MPPAVPETKATWTNAVDALSSTNLHAYLRDPIKFVMSKPMARLLHTVSQTALNGIWTSVLFAVESVDTDPDGIGGHSTVTNTTRYTARYPGWYLVNGVAAFNTSAATGMRCARWAVNGSAVAQSETLVPAGAGLPTAVPARSMYIPLGAGDYVELQVMQSLGSSLATSAGGGSGISLDIAWERLA